MLLPRLARADQACGSYATVVLSEGSDAVAGAIEPEARCPHSPIEVSPSLTRSGVACQAPPT